MENTTQLLYSASDRSVAGTADAYMSEPYNEGDIEENSGVFIHDATMSFYKPFFFFFDRGNPCYKTI